jgi:thiamine-monophosphate kinase
LPALDEFDLIERYFTRSGNDESVVLGIGDDAAIISVSGRVAVAVDTLVSGVHFPIELAPYAIGHRALAVNLSDLAAMGAVPRWATLALTVPAADPSWLSAFAGGFFALADRFDVKLIGGDTTRGPLTVTVQVMGMPAAESILCRSAGRSGDAIYVTGTLGDAAAGIAAMAASDVSRDAGEPDADRAELIRRFACPDARIAAGCALAPIAHAAIDVSDGLTADLAHICEQSRLGAVIDFDLLPLSEALLAVHGPQRALDFALTGGDDYELCFTAAQADANAVMAVAAATATRITRIGEMTSAMGLRSLLDGQESPLPAAGYRHFR